MSRGEYKRFSTNYSTYFKHHFKLLFKMPKEEVEEGGWESLPRRKNTYGSMQRQPAVHATLSDVNNLMLATLAPDDRAAITEDLIRKETVALRSGKEEG